VVDLKPHRSRYWLNHDRGNPEEFAKNVQKICTVYREAPMLLTQGTHVVSTDEKTGMQALERLHPTLPMKPGLVERREFEYIRHGTQCLIGNLEVATGKMISPTIGETRTEKDFIAHISNTVSTHPDAQWIFVADQLNTHKSEGLVRFIAEQCHLLEDLGCKGKRGILESQKTRKQFLEDPSHRIRFVFTPKHCSWLNQIEISFGTLSRKLLRRGNFLSQADLRGQILSFVEYRNKTARPFRWTYEGKVLSV
jgi:hypothetical protein